MTQNRFIAIEMEVQGVKKLSRLMAVSSQRVRNLRPAFDAIADDFVVRESRVFARSGSIGKHRKWAALSKLYVAQKRRQGYSSRILVRTGRLKASLTNRSHPDFVFRPTNQSMEIGTKVPYAKFHETGTEKMPKREPIRVTEIQKRTWVRLMHQYILQTGQFERMHL